ncbi:MAG: hypothetical protein ACLQHT_17405 [Terracidiphilus sp.]
MAASLDDVTDLQEYFRIIGRSGHHAGQPNAVILALAGAVVLFKDRDTTVLAIGEGEPPNVPFLTINGRRYAFAYNHNEGIVEIRRDSLRGDLVGTFTNESRLSDVYELLRGLRQLQGSD